MSVVEVRALECRSMQDAAELAERPLATSPSAAHEVRLTLAAAPDSRAAQPLHRARAAWRAQAPIQRMRAVGATALLAALVHVALQATARPAGWWWLILPGLLATFGSAALGLSFAGPARKDGE